MSKSANLAFHLIAIQKHVLPKARLDLALKQADAQGVSIEGYLLDTGNLDLPGIERIVTVRERHGRACQACGQKTYLLPGETIKKPCEHCGGALVATAAPADAAGPATDPAPAAEFVTITPADAVTIAEAHAPAPVAAVVAPSSPPTSDVGAVLEPKKPAPRPSGSGPVRPRPSSPTAKAAPRAAAPAPVATPAPAAAATPAPAPAARPAPAPAAPAKPTPAPAAAAAKPTPAPAAATVKPTPAPAAAAAAEKAPAPAAAAVKPPAKPAPAPALAAAKAAPAATSAGSPSASDYLGSEAPAGPKPFVAYAEESEDEKKARLRRLRLVGGGLGGSEPAPVAPEPDPVVADAPVEPAVTPRPSRRFAPPPVAPEPDPVAMDDARFAPPPPAAAADDDARFAPPVAHRAASVASPDGLKGIVDRPTRPLTEELGTLLSFPGSPFGLFMVSAGAALLFLISAVILNPIAIVPLPALLALVPVLLYIYSYLVVVTEAASQGREELPDWPDLGDAAGLGWRMFLVNVAAFAPALVVFCIVWKAGGGGIGIDPKVHPTIGPQATGLAGASAVVAPGTPARDAAFVSLDGAPAPLAGKWTIVGLLGRDNVDDTGMSEMFAEMPSAGMGVTIDHAAQIYDLDRVGRALKEKVAVYAAFADPRCKIVWGRHPYAVPDSVRQQHGYLFEHESSVGGEEEDTRSPPSFDGHAGEDEELGDFDVSDETAEGLARARGTASKNAIAQGGPAPRAVAPTNPFKTVQFIRTDEHAFPAPFNKVKGLPAVYILDPQGVVKREYTTGVDDRKLYADLLDLLSGGDGDALRTDLPPSAYGITAKGLGAGRVIGGGLLLLLIGFGVFYLPMALLLMVSFNDGAMAFNYPAGLKAIGAATKDYVVVAGVFVGTTIAGSMLNVVASVTISKVMGPILGWFLREYVNHWIWFYGALVSAYAVGRFYYRNRDVIGWFSRR